MINTNPLASVGAYTSMQDINALHHQLNANPDLAKKEVAAQFESLLVQMLMKSMRDANMALSNDANGDSTSSQEAALYHDLFDKQLSLVVSHSGTGLAKLVEDSIDRSQGKATASGPLNLPDARPMTLPPEPVKTTLLEPTEKEAAIAAFDSTSDFVKQLWSSAKNAASLLGADPKFLLAQAALETNWGKQILPMSTGASTHNLFNIKADSSWTAPLTHVNAIEYEDGLMVKSKSKFRAYESYQDSFNDYVHFLKNNGRYEEALKHASDPHQFAQQLQKASYATDENYSKKIMQIYSSKKFNDLFIDHKLI